jgi:CheY-like chemotaxis protein
VHRRTFGTTVAITVLRLVSDSFWEDYSVGAVSETVRLNDEKDEGRKGSSLRILVVENESDGVVGMAQRFDRSGHQILLAPNLRTARRVATAKSPDVVLLDMDLPGLDRQLIAQWVSGWATGRRPLFIAFGGCESGAEGPHCPLAGVHLQLHKPVDIALVCAVLKRFQTVLEG